MALLSSLLGESSSRSWHQILADVAPDAHIDWLKIQGFDEKQAIRVKWLSKDMNEHDKYMQDFMTIYETLESWGPNSESDTVRAFQTLNINPIKILEIGCGKGNSTMLLARLCDAHIVATDNEQSALDKVEDKIKQNNVGERVSTQCISMTELSFGEEKFDVIWAEASAYVMGIENALEKWKSLISEDGALVFSDLVWLTETPSKEAIKHWKSDYPDMQTVDNRKLQIEKAGYKLQHTFTLSEQAWKNYYEPLEQRLNEVGPTLAGSQAVADIQNEVAMFKSHLGEFGYQFFIAEKC